MQSSRAVTDKDKKVGQRLRIARKLKGMSQRELGPLIGVRWQQLQKYESGMNRISASRIALAANALGCSIEFLVGVPSHVKQQMPNLDLVYAILQTPYGPKLCRLFCRLEEKQQRLLFRMAQILAKMATNRNLLKARRTRQPRRLGEP
jgi:transcriptional regulator with XRE-family HTH domain